MVEVRCLGDFAVVVGASPQERWRAGKARSLFQFLLVNRGRLVSGARLCEVLWPDREVSPRSSSLKVTMHAVRKALAPLGGRIVVEHDNGFYRLTSRDVSIDVDELDACAGAARRAERDGDVGVALEFDRRVAALYTGEFLPGEDADWVVEQREWAKALALHSLRRLSAEALRDNDYPGAIAACRRILEIDPCAEGAYQALMIMHARLGAPGRVRSWYDLCVRRLRTELDVEPAALTRRILIGSLRGDLRATADPALAAA